MYKLTFFFCLVSISSWGQSQDISPERLGFEAFQISEDKLGTINYYLTENTGKQKKPLLVYLDGSGAFPLFQQLEDGYMGSTVVINYKELSADYRVLLISKPGVPFADTVGRDKSGFPTYEEPKEYIEKLSLGWRVESANLVINSLIDSKKIDTAKVIVLGFSEGAQVAPFLAEKNTYVTHILLFGGNGLNQLYDPIIKARLKAKTGQISEVQAQQEIDSLFQMYKKIYTNPGSTDTTWWGHTYKRWASFTQNDPLETLLKLEIPIYVAKGSLDQNSVLSADYIQLEFIKHKKDNLTYKTYPGYDHQFRELVFENNQFMKAIPRMDAVFNEAFEWLNDN